MKSKSLPIVYCAALLCVLTTVAFCQAASGEGEVARLSSYDDLILTGRLALKSGRLEKSMDSAKAAIKADESRYEGYALAAFVAKEKREIDKAKELTSQALEKAPETKRPALQDLQESLLSGTRLDNPQLSGEVQRKYEAVMQIIEDSDKAITADERSNLLKEFLTKSAKLLELAPDYTNIWLVRAAAAMELDFSGTGWLAGRKLKQLGLDRSDDPTVRKIMVSLERSNWLGDKGLWYPAANASWENSLGMKFVPVPGTKVLFGVWDVRVKDYRTYSSATAGVDNSWQSPGFTVHPRSSSLQSWRL
jgi:tetratricopeptide (TPR) repeat protein